MHLKETVYMKMYLTSSLMPGSYRNGVSLKKREENKNADGSISNKHEDWKD